ncbi:hypothetical protein AXG93_2062s1330 [Marchantia polymorpha subsp. ruderalis]|uniref:Uncharacterized protein n=1 Tax=Marchantia polymorpha subsp. ruderalis TaxID=1480154 RepID=A0A176VFG7_MARPO|nr:hypothetical protein AXG93_2062s1330 [Marchantia polymorpha subsp. ruderalis]
MASPDLQHDHADRPLGLAALVRGQDKAVSRKPASASFMRHDADEISVMDLTPGNSQYTVLQVSTVHALTFVHSSVTVVRELSRAPDSGNTGSFSIDAISWCPKKTADSRSAMRT